jgi:hypothetical protein
VRNNVAILATIEAATGKRETGKNRHLVDESM